MDALYAQHSTAQHSTAHKFNFLIPFITAVLVACGGGGGSTTTDTTTACSVGVLNIGFGYTSRLSLYQSNASTHSPTITGVPNSCINRLTFSVSSGALPQGMNLNAATGVISGVPTNIEANTFQISLKPAGYYAVPSNAVSYSISASPVDNFVGTWRSSCISFSGSITDRATGSGAWGQWERIYTKVSGTELSSSLAVRIFNSTNTSCSGTPAANITRTGSSNGSYQTTGTTISSSLGSNLYTFKGATSVDGFTVDMVDTITAPLSLSGAVETLTGFTVSTASFPATTTKQIVLLQNSTMRYGDRTLVDSLGYPTHLQTGTFVYTKQ